MGLSALAAKAESVIASTKLGLQARILSSRLEGELAVPPTGRSDLNYIPDLPKVDSGHILRGVERPKPSASGNVTVSKPGGFHHEPSGVPGRAEVIRGTRSRSDNLGVYSARVRLRNDATKDFLASSPQSSGPKFREKFSTMFPASMPDFRVIQSIKDAWRNRLAIGGSDIGRAASYPLTPSGGTLWLRMHSSAPDAIRSAWPLRSYSEMLQVPLLKRPTYRAK